MAKAIREVGAKTAEAMARVSKELIIPKVSRAAMARATRAATAPQVAMARATNKAVVRVTRKVTRKEATEKVVTVPKEGMAANPISVGSLMASEARASWECQELPDVVLGVLAEWSSGNHYRGHHARDSGHSRMFERMFFTYTSTTKMCIACTNVIG
mmetsp:Transcript_105190/g.185849  ORF Transcript_105190/g.185849 Transcript_105190/m.185849 type:complete len:157 (+) Transcript_105190:1462-1932(+)